MSGKVKWYEKKYILALCFLSVVFAPLGVLLLWGSEKYTKKAKVAFGAAAAAVFLGGSFFGACTFGERLGFLGGSVATDVCDAAVNKETSVQKPGKQAKSKAVASKIKEDKRKVYVTVGGKKYRLSDCCGKGKYFPLSLSKAVKKGYKACKKCVSET